jgi:hypothetical protein
MRYAAAILIAWGLWPAGPSGVRPDPATSVAQEGPVRVEQNWSQVSYEGLVFPDEQTPLRKIRQQSLEHRQWIDAEHGIRMESTVPRENTILVKASVY